VNLHIGQIEFIAALANNVLFIHGRALRSGKPGVALDPGANLPPGKFKWKRGTWVGG